MLKLGRNSCRLICQIKTGQSIIHSSLVKKRKTQHWHEEKEDEGKSGDADGDDEATWEFCNSDIQEQVKHICNSSDDQSHSCIFFILPKEPMTRFFFVLNFSFQKWQLTRLNYPETVKDVKIWI